MSRDACPRSQRSPRRSLSGNAGLRPRALVSDTLSACCGVCPGSKYTTERGCTSHVSAEKPSEELRGAERGQRCGRGRHTAGLPAESVREASCGPGAWRPLKQVASGQNHSLQRPRAQRAPGGALPSVCSRPGAAPSCSGRWGPARSSSRSLSAAGGCQKRRERDICRACWGCVRIPRAFCGSSAKNCGRIQEGPVGWPGAGLPGEGAHGGLNGFPRRAGRWGVCPQDPPAVGRGGRASPGDSSPKPARGAETVHLRPGPRGQRSEP